VAVLVRCSSTAVLGTIVLVASAICFGSAAVRAECVTGLEQPQICGALGASDAVFLADVEDVRLVPGSGSYEVRFRVLEAFKGISVGERTLRFIGSSESFSFQVGQRVLVYAGTDGDAWTTQCSRTRLADKLTEELEVLRALVARVPGGLVDGHVVTADGANTYPGLRVMLRATSGRRIVHSVTTNGAGYFRFEWLSPGVYTLVVEGGSFFLNEQKTFVVRKSGTCLTVPVIVLRSRVSSR